MAGNRLLLVLFCNCSALYDRVENKLAQILFYVIPEDFIGNPVVFVSEQKSLDSRQNYSGMTAYIVG